MGLRDRIHNPDRRTDELLPIVERRNGDERRAGYMCEACGSDDPRPVTHKTWCSVRILEPSLHRFGAGKDLTGTCRHD